MAAGESFSFNAGRRALESKPRASAMSCSAFRRTTSRTVRGVVQGDSRPREFIPRLVDLFMKGRFPLDRLVTRYDFADINQAAADATSGATIKPILKLPH